jgi:hypothetical protein
LTRYLSFVPIYISAVRTLSGRTRRLANTYVFTSVLTVLELLDGCCITQSEYAKRRAALNTIIASKIPVVPEMPAVAIARSFSVITSASQKVTTRISRGRKLSERSTRSKTEL